MSYVAQAFKSATGGFLYKSVLGKNGLPRKYENLLRKNVRYGARQLDKVAPDWFSQKAISLKSLDLRESCQCVFGQLETAVGGKGDAPTIDLTGLIKVATAQGYYYEGDEAFSAVCVLEEMENENYGYTYVDLYDADLSEGTIEKLLENSTIPLDQKAFAVLQDEWVTQIKKRRAKAKVAA